MRVCAARRRGGSSLLASGCKTLEASEAPDAVAASQTSTFHIMKGAPKSAGRGTPAPRRVSGFGLKRQRRPTARPTAASALGGTWGQGRTRRAGPGFVAPSAPTTRRRTPRRRRETGHRVVASSHVAVLLRGRRRDGGVLVHGGLRLRSAIISIRPAAKPTNTVCTACRRHRARRTTRRTPPLPTLWLRHARARRATRPRRTSAPRRRENAERRPSRGPHNHRETLATGRSPPSRRRRSTDEHAAAQAAAVLRGFDDGDPGFFGNQVPNLAEAEAACDRTASITAENGNVLERGAGVPAVDTSSGGDDRCCLTLATLAKIMARAAPNAVACILRRPAPHLMQGQKRSRRPGAARPRDRHVRKRTAEGVRQQLRQRHQYTRNRAERRAKRAARRTRRSTRDRTHVGGRQSSDRLVVMRTGG